MPDHATRPSELLATPVSSPWWPPAGEPLAVVADDLTGAADAVAAFVPSGRRVRVELHAADAVVLGDEIVAVSTGTRGLRGDKVHGHVAPIVSRMLERGIGRLYIKIDSTMRGEVAAQLGAVRDIVREVTGRDQTALVCPAFPAMGRTVRDGRLRCDDPHGHSDVDVRERLDQVGALTLAGLDVVRRGPESVADLLSTRRGGVVVCDAITDEDLDVVAKAVAVNDEQVLPVGSGGLAAALARRLLPAPLLDGAPPPCADASSAQRVLVVVGSRQDRSRAQLADLKRRPGVISAELSTAPGDDPDAWELLAEHLASADSQVVALATSTQDAPGERSPGGEVAARLGSTVARFLDVAGHSASAPVGLVVTGGDVAAAVLNTLEAAELSVWGEVEAGMPLTTIMGGRGAHAPLVTKAGGFGSVDCLTATVGRLTANSEAP